MISSKVCSVLCKAIIELNVYFSQVNAGVRLLFFHKIVFQLEHVWRRRATYKTV